jgi:microcystin degradation protein MlrC
MQVFIAGLATETNTFAPFPTGWAGFEENGIVRDASRGSSSFCSPAMAAFRAGAEAAGDTVHESIAAFAQPAGRTVRKVYESLRDTILEDLKAAGPVDLVLLVLHGAMVADGYDDCEGDLIGRVRALLPDATIGVEIDPHCHLTHRMVEDADVIIIFKEYPHIDSAERAVELFDICRRAASGELKPVAALVDTHVVGMYPTFDQPMRGIVDGLHAAEARAGVLSASIGHGFPWADVADVGTRVLVYADNDPALAGAEAMAIARRLYDERYALIPNYTGVSDSLDRAATLNGRIVMSDYSDNAGGGAPGDSTFFLRALIERDVENAVIGCFHDPAVAHICADAGVGARLDIRLGGKSGPASGDPIDLFVEVMAVVENHSQDVFGGRHGMGLTVWLRHRGVDILVNTIRSQVYGVDLFTGCGIDLETKRFIVVKSSTHYEAAYRPIADHLWPVVTPGALSLDFARLPYTRRDPDFFPRIPDPWSVKGEPEPRLFSRKVSV